MSRKVGDNNDRQGPDRGLTIINFRGAMLESSYEFFLCIFFKKPSCLGRFSLFKFRWVSALTRVGESWLPHGGLSVTTGNGSN